MTPEQKALHELSLVAHDEPSTYRDIKDALVSAGLIRLGYPPAHRPTQDLSDGDGLTPLGQDAYDAAVSGLVSWLSARQ